MKKLAITIYLIIVALLLLLFLLSNSSYASLNFNPFLHSHSPLSITLPFGVWFLLALIIGYTIGLLTQIPRISSLKRKLKQHHEIKRDQ